MHGAPFNSIVPWPRSGKFNSSPFLSLSTTSISSAPPSPFPCDARHVHCLPHRGLCPPLHPRSLSLVGAHGHRRPIRSQRAQPRRCISCVLPMHLHPPLPLTLIYICCRSGNPFRESGPPACMAKLIMMRHKVRKKTAPLSHSHKPPCCAYMHELLTCTPAVKPSQHAMAAHFYGRSTYPTASVHITDASPTASVMDPHPQTFRSTTPLTQHPLFLLSLSATNQRRFMHALAFVASSHQTTTLTTIPHRPL